MFIFFSARVYTVWDKTVSFGKTASPRIVWKGRSLFWPIAGIELSICMILESLMSDKLALYNDVN